jgi:hypothetical protein
MFHSSIDIDLPAQDHANVRSSSEYCSLIRETWRRGVESTIAAGQLLIEARQQLEHGEFALMIKAKLPFDASTARRLMIVAEHPVLSNRAHGHVLPPSWRTLYELSKVPHDVLLARIADGTVHPGMERGDVSAILGRPAAKAKKPAHLTAAQVLEWLGTQASPNEKQELKKRIGRQSNQIPTFAQVLEWLVAKATPAEKQEFKKRILGQQDRQQTKQIETAIKAIRLAQSLLKSNTGPDRNQALAALDGALRTLEAA